MVAFPPVVTEARRVISDVYVFLMLPSRLGFEGLDRAGGYVYYIKAFGWGIGWPMLVLACVGIVWAVVRREWPLLIVASLPVCLYLVMGTSHMYAARFMLPGVPALIVLTAIVINDVGTRALLPAALLAGLVLAGTLPATLRLTHSLPVPIREPRRDRGSRRMCRPAHAWLQKHRRSVHLSRICLWILSPRGTMLSTTSRWRVIARRASGISSRAHTRQRPRISILRATHRLEFYASLQRDAEQLAEFRPYAGAEPDFVYDRIYGPFDSLERFDQPGPTIRVFRLASEMAHAP